MNPAQNDIATRFLPLFDDYDVEMRPADAASLDFLEEALGQRGVPSNCIDQLQQLYQITDQVPGLDGLDVHHLRDEIIFEWWEQDGALWLAQRDMDIIRWKDGQFHLGDASNISYGEGYSSADLFEVIKKAFSEWYPQGYGF